MNGLLVLSTRDLNLALSMDLAIQANDLAFRLYSSGRTVTPQRLHMALPDGTSLLKPSFLEPDAALAIKVVGVYPKNKTLGLETIQGVVLLLDGATGKAKAVMDGKRLTAIRTGAAAGAATRLLSSPESRVFALLGAGGMAPDQARAVLAVRPIEEMRIFSPGGASAARLAGELSEAYPGLRVAAVESPSRAVMGADVITVVTTSQTPVFDPGDVKPGAHINGMGSFTPQAREVDLRGLVKPRVWVDSLESAMTEAGDIIQAVDDRTIRPEDLEELGRALAQEKQRHSPEGITFFKSVGLAAQDAASAQAAYLRARELGLGSLVEL